MESVTPTGLNMGDPFFGTPTVPQNPIRVVGDGPKLLGLPLLKNPLVIFGAGHLGKQVFEGVRKAGYDPVCYVDNDPAKRGWTLLEEFDDRNPIVDVPYLNGLPILHPNVLEDSNTPVLIAIHNNTSVKPQLAELNCKSVTYVEMFRRHAECFPEEKRMMAIPASRMPADKTCKAFKLMGDERSRLEFGDLSLWQCGHDVSLPPHSPASETYFPPDLFKLTDHEVFYDCGAFDGDTIKVFLEKCGAKFEYVIAFEPDSSNFSELRRRVRSIGARSFRIDTYQCAIGNEHGEVAFNADGSAGACISSSGNSAVEVWTMDEALSIFKPPTIIKMDIEGSEADALQGAAQLIAQHKPILAIAAYHHYWDLWELPLLIHKLNPDYKIFLRRYAEDCWETVYYAIPPERCLVK